MRNSSKLQLLGLILVLLLPLYHSDAFSIGGYKFDFKKCISKGMGGTVRNDGCSVGHVIYEGYSSKELNEANNAGLSADALQDSAYMTNQEEFGKSLRIHWKPKADLQNTFKFAIRSDLKNVETSDVLDVIYYGGKITKPVPDSDGGIRSYGEKLGGEYPRNEKIQVVLPSRVGVFFTVKNPGVSAVIKPDLTTDLANTDTVDEYLSETDQDSFLKDQANPYLSGIAQPIDCPLTENSLNEYVVDFIPVPLENNPTNSSTNEIIGEINLPIGNYSVTAVTWDNHNKPSNPVQQNERVYFELSNTQNRVIATTQSTEDIPEEIDSITSIFASNTVLTSPATKIAAKHSSSYGSVTNESVYPICAKFTNQSPASTTPAIEKKLEVECKVSDTTPAIDDPILIWTEIFGGKLPYISKWSGDYKKASGFDKNSLNQTVSFSKKGNYKIKVSVEDSEKEKVKDTCPTIKVSQDGENDDIIVRTENNNGATNVNPITTVASYSYYRDLTIGSQGEDVVALQQYLVARKYLVMPTNIAYGYFGELTRSAVAQWQASKGITPALGYFGAQSREIIAK